MGSLSHLNALRALESSVRLGSFSAAAIELGVTPAAVGQQVRNLEKAIGRQLLDRRANGFKPTPVAVSATAKLSSGFGDLRDALSIMARQETRNRLFVTVTPTIGERWLAPRLSEFLSEHSAIDLRIDSTPHVLHQPNLEFDFALRYDRPRASGRPETELFGEILIPVGTPEIAERVGPMERADCLSDVPLIHVDRSTDDPDWYHWHDWGKAFGYDIPQRPRGVHATFTTLALRSLYSGHGLHLAQLSITLPDLVSGRLIAPFGTSRCVTPGYPYSLVKIAEGRETDLLKAFRDWIVSEARATQAEMDAYLSA